MVGAGVALHAGIVDFLDPCNVDTNVGINDFVARVMLCNVLVALPGIGIVNFFEALVLQRVQSDRVLPSPNPAALTRGVTPCLGHCCPEAVVLVLSLLLDCIFWPE